MRNEPPRRYAVTIARLLAPASARLLAATLARPLAAPIARPLAASIARLLAAPGLVVVLGALGASSVSAQVPHELRVDKVPGDPSAFLLSWAEYAPGATYEVRRGTDPADRGDWIPLITTDQLEWIDITEPPGLVFYDLTANGLLGCVDDAFEENDDAASAADPADDWMELIHCTGDDDWFRVQLAAGETARGAVAYDRAEGALLLELLAPDGVTVLEADPWTVHGVAVVDGWHYFRVTGDELPYRALFQGPFASAACGIDYASPNHSQAEALPGWPHQDLFTFLTLCDGEEDWFVEDVLPDHWLSVWVDPFFNLDVSPDDVNWIIVDILDDSGGLVVSLDSRYEYTGFDRHFPAGGRFFVRIRGFISDDGYWDHVYEKTAYTWPD